MYFEDWQGRFGPEGAPANRTMFDKYARRLPQMATANQVTFPNRLTTRARSLATARPNAIQHERF